MLNNIRNFENSLASLFNEIGLPLQLRLWDGAKSLPHVARSNNSFYEGTVLGKDVIFVIFDDAANDDPIKKIELLRKFEKRPLIIVADRLRRGQRQHLILRRLDFVILKRQLFLPSLLIVLEQVFKEPGKRSQATLTPSAQCTLFYLLMHPMETRSQRREAKASALAPLLGFSAMTIGRALDELAQSDSVSLDREGRDKYLEFSAPAREVFEAFAPAISSPVKRTKFARVRPELALPIGGETALASYTSLIMPPTTTFAMMYKFWDSADLVEMDPTTSNDKIDLWAYDPFVLSGDGRVDRLSLYAQFRDDMNERVAMAANEMIEDIDWH